MRHVGNAVLLLILAGAIVWVSTGISDWMLKESPAAPAVQYVLIEVTR
jgi:hypothetical protein